VTPKIAIATCRDFPVLTDDDRPLLAALAARGVAAEPVLWDADVDWRDHAAVLLRSVWDYWLRAEEFTRWLDLLEQLGVPCWNPVPLVRWNMDKRYLRDLAARGILTVPTLWIERESRSTPDEAVALVANTGWDDLVLKPTVSAGAWRTLRLRRDEVAGRTDYLREVLEGSSLMAQPFMAEVVEVGELSLLFFGGEYSHAALKRPRAGDFRVQWIHGGGHEPATPSPSILEQARAVVSAAPPGGLYARVDGVVRDGRFVLMELEMIEPYLFLTEGPGSVDRFVHALCARLWDPVSSSFTGPPDRRPP
jgi:glutathione synthase/RimK-type ligase-like ATP-grasp enzyme